MSQYETPRTGLTGAIRSDSNARLHSLTKPYNRPLPPSQTTEFGQQAPKSAATTRPHLSKSASARSFGSLTRSGSDTSLFSNLKSLVSRPLTWFTPTKKERDEDDAEMGDRPDNTRKRSDEGSPDQQPGTKKSRRHSPVRDMDNYAPGATSSRPNGLPPLGPDVTLSRRSVPNFSRPLPTSHSESYLDMPTDLLGSPSRRALTRSSRMNLAEASEPTNWSPWQQRHSSRLRSSMTPAELPFAPASPTRNVNTITRSATAARLAREDSVTNILRSPTPTRSLAGDDRMSVDRETTYDRPASLFSRVSATPVPSRNQMHWDSSLGSFTRDFGRASTQEVQQNEAERILMGLQSARSGPLDRARTEQSMIPSILGSSARDLRHAIEVPMAARQTAERRAKERLGDNHNSAITPYGRIERKYKEQQQKRREESQMSVDRESSKAPSPSPTPTTPRRSGRNHKPSEEPTPKGKGKRVSSQQPDERPTRRSTRRTPSERGSPPPTTKASAVPPVPTITETAASPSTQPKASGSTYRVLASDEQSTKSSLRATSSYTNRAHNSGPTSRNGSRATSPDSGRFSAKEADLPEMDDLSSEKIALPSFGAVKFGDFSAPNPPSTLSASPKKVIRPPQGPLVRSRTTERRKSPLATQPSIIAEPDTPPAKKPEAKQDADGFYTFGGPKPAAPAPSDLFGAAGEKKTFSGLGMGKPSAPSFTAESTTPKVAPPATTFTFGAAASAPPPAMTAVKGNGGGSVFGGQAVDVEGIAAKTAPALLTSGDKPASAAASEAPKAAPTFNFGGSTETPKTDAPKTTPSFGAPATDKPAAPAFNFGGASTTTEAPKSTFTGFGASADKPADKAAPVSNGFSFTPPAPAEKPSEAPKNMFGASTNMFGSSTPTTEPPKTTFGTSTPATEPPKNLFGSTPAPEAPKFSTTPAAEPPKSTFNFSSPAPATDKPAFAFGQTTGATTAAKPAEASTGLNATKPAESTFSFGSQSAKPAETAPAPAFQFGQTASTPAATPSPTGFAFNQPKPASSAFGTTTSGAFGAKSPASAFGAPPAANGTPTFGFGADAPKTTFGAAPATGFGAPAATTTAAFGTAPAAPSTSFGFGQTNTTPANGTNGFGATGAFGSAPTAPAFGAAPAQTNGFGGFGGTATPPTNPTSFNFNSNPSTPAAQPGTFNFNAPAPATGTFQFGANGTASQPASPSVNTNTFTFGAQNGGGGTQRFGSPAPTGGDGGFSMGVAPASPSAGPRPIKGLRRKK